MADKYFIIDFVCLGTMSLMIVLLLNIIGKIVLPFYNTNKIERLFFVFFMECLTGFVFLVTVYSVYLFGIYTLNIITFILGLSYIVYRLILKKEKPVFNFNLFVLKKTFFIILIPYFVLLISILLPLGSSVNMDVSFYCKIAESFNVIKSENYNHFFNLQNDAFHGATPYHYIEMYLGSIAFKLYNWTNYPDLIIFKYVIYNALRVIVVCGLLAMIERFRKVRIWELLLVMIVISIDFVQLNNYGKSDYPLYTGIWMRPNFVTYYLFLIPAFENLFEKNLKGTMVFAYFLIIASISVMPSIILTSIVLAIGFGILDKTKRKTAIISSFSIIALVLIVYCYYKLVGASSQIITSTQLSFGEMIAKTVSIWKAILGYLFSLSVRLFILILIAFLPIILTGRKNTLNYVRDNKFFLITVILLPFSGIILFQILAYQGITYQLPYIGYTACFLLFIFNLGYSFNIEKPKEHRLIYSLGLIILIAYCSYGRIIELVKIIHIDESISDMELNASGLTKIDIDELKIYFNKTSSLKGGNLLEQKDFIEQGRGARASQIVQQGYFLAYLQDNTNTELLTDPNRLYPDKEEASDDYKKTYAFNSMTDFYRKYNKDSTYEFNLKEYIVRNNIKYLFLSKSFDPGSLSYLDISKKIKIQSSGCQILILKR